MSRQFIKNDTQMVNQQIKRHYTSLVTRRVWMKTQQKTLTPTGKATIKRREKPSAARDAEKQEPVATADGNAK